jgi:small-conductance mechanosensitive channel
MFKKYFLIMFLTVFLLPGVFGQGTEGGAEAERIVESVTDTIEKEIEKTAISTRSILKLENYSLIVRVGIAAGLSLLLILLIWLTWKLAGFVTKKTRIYGAEHFKPIKLKKIVLMDVDQMLKISAHLINILKLIVFLLQIIITVPLIFHLFETTRGLSTRLLGYILTPIKQFAVAFVNYIPNLFAIAVILLISRYILRTIKFFATQIERRKLVIPGFYSDWASPTFNIMRVLIYAFTVAAIYPYIPNSDSDIFKGISVLVGVLFSLGSSSVIGNLIAGIVMTYMRPFQIGDRIKINDITGFVVERGPMNMRIRTHKNEYVSFPNQMILNTSVINFNSSTTAGLDGYIVHAVVTMGYDFPWNKVHEILINAALKTENTEKTPAPFVNQTKLDDFYCWYEINAYTKNVSMLPAIYSELFRNIQDGFAAANISMYAPHYEVYTKGT